MAGLLATINYSAARITSAEYYIGTDPGVGSAIPIEASVGAAALTEALTLATDSLGEGTHDIGLRVQDSSGNWSNTVLRRITVLSSELVDATTATAESAQQNPEALNQTVAAEYYIGTDPGQGQRLPYQSKRAWVRPR